MSLLWHILLQMLIGSGLCIVPFGCGLNGTDLSAASPPPSLVHHAQNSEAPQ